MSHFHRGCTPIVSRQSRIPASWLLYHHSVLSICLILPITSPPIKGIILCVSIYLFICIAGSRLSLERKSWKQWSRISSKPYGLFHTIPVDQYLRRLRGKTSQQFLKFEIRTKSSHVGFWLRCNMEKEEQEKKYYFCWPFRLPNCSLQSYFSDHGCHLSISNDIQQNPGGFSGRDNLRREDMLAVPRRNWCKPSSLSLELAILFLISSMEICVHRLSWCSSFLAFCKAKV